MSKLRFSVCFCSGEEPEYPAEELNAHSPHTRGWQSPQFCDYPQELGLAWEAPARVSQVQILSHQSKIATQIELFVGHGDSYESAHFRRLGYLSLNSNERSKYQARELKSVYVNAPGQYLRMLVHKCYINEVNLFNQVGIVAVNLLGEKLGKLAPGALDDPAAPYGAGPRTLRAYPPGLSGREIGAARASHTELNDLSFDMNFDPEAAQRIRDIANAKDRAARAEDYDTAKLLKEAETQLKSLGKQLAKLEVAKRQAVEDEDYDRAKMLKVEADSLRLQIAAHPNPELRIKLEEAGVQDVEGEDRTAPGYNAGPGREEGDSAASPNQLPVDERPIVAREHGQGRAGASPDERYSGGSGYGGTDAVQGSPPKAPPRILHSGEGRRAHGSPHPENEGWEVRDGEDAQEGRYPPGEHPLEGVPDLEDLTEPEPLSAKVDLSEVQGLNNLLGDYLTRCLYSKTWSLREAAVLKIKLILPALEEDPGINSALTELCQILRVGFEDKIAQVFLTTLDLLEAVLMSVGACKEARHNHVVAALEPTVATLLKKQGDGQARLRDGAMNGLVAVARCRTAGPVFVSHVALKPLVKKQLSAWRPITARLVLLRKLVSEFGLEGGGLTADGIMSFIQSCNGFAHSNGDVRDAARELTVALHGLVGEEIEPYLMGLRPKQLDEYHEAFRHSKGKTSRRASSATRTRTTPRRGEPERSPLETATPRTARSAGGSNREKTTTRPDQSRSPLRTEKGGAHASPAKSPTQAFSAEEAEVGQTKESEEMDDDVSCTCQFCGKYDPSFTDEKLDMHYWQNCPLLMSCEECGQVIEISSIPEHLLEECQNRENYTECEISHLAIRIEDLDRWQRSKSCKPPGKGGPGSTCPLCFEDVGSADDEEYWRAHLIDSCTRNPRRV
ncbi:unnamed protein product [Ectocarpus sp. CCAP 1310/34]|nr:unnamed protein product [Ectocarpus sp. CCAP 1310/34]